MARLKIDYGIDLGTTNSAICRMESGEPVIKKTDTLKDTMPSCISVNKKRSIKCGDGAYNDMKSDKRRATKTWKRGTSNTYVEFKRTMGTDMLYHSSNMDKDYTSEELSSEVLKALRSFITDESVNAAVVTVPAKFNANQVAATKRAAKMAGIEHCEILQEPIAASMAYGLTTQEKNGYWMVFDFGGGTFDAALLKVEDGIMQVFDTAGDNYLGGKNLDEAIVDNIILPYLKDNYVIDGILADNDKRDVLREAMKTYAEEAKIALSFKQQEDIISNLGDLGEDEDGEEIELDITITQNQLFGVLRPIFQKAVDICISLLQRNNMTGAQLNKLILVGGPTHSPLIRQMLKEQVTPNVDTSIDPMTAVASGAALYASTIDNENKVEKVAGTIQLDVKYEATSVELIEWVSVKLDTNNSEWGCPNRILVELVRGDKAWSSGKVEVDSMGNVIEANLIEGKPNLFTIVAYDEKGTMLPCFPNAITIIQGSKVGSAVLPYNIGIEVWNREKNRAVFETIPGLEKTRTYPATGVKNGLKTTTLLRPGVEQDTLKIPIYQAEYKGDGKSAILFEHIDDVIITGLEVDSLIAENSEVELTIKAVKDGLYDIDIYFPSVDFTISKPLEVNKVQKTATEAYLRMEIAKANHTLQSLADDDCNVDKLSNALKEVETELSNGSQKQQVLEHLRNVLRDIEELDSSSEWERIEKELRRMYDELEKDQQKYGDSNTAQMVNQLRSSVDQAIRAKDVKLAKDVLQQVRDLDYKLALIEYLVVWIINWSRDFDSLNWKDRNRARQLINQGMSMINSNPTAERLLPLVQQIINLLPQTQLPQGAGGLLQG